MKVSAYNIFIPHEYGNPVVYNTLSDAILAVDNTVLENLRAGRIENIGPDALQTMTECGMLVGDDVDERRILSYNFLAKKFSSRIARVLVLTTYDCNLACPYCYQKAIQKSRKSMDRRTTDNLVSFIRKVYEERRFTRLILGLYGGEPLLNPECCYRACDQLRAWTGKKGVRFDVILTTNALLLSGEIIERLFPLFLVHVTLDGPREIHDRKRSSRDGNGSYDRIMEMLDLLRGRNIRTTIRINVANDNIAAVPLLLKDLKDRGILDSPDVRVYTQILGQPRTKDVPEPVSGYLEGDDLEKARLFLWGLGKEWGFDAGDPGIEPCPFVNDWSFAVDPWGDVYKCPMWVGDKQYRVGTLREKGTVRLEPAFYNQMSFDPILDQACRDCPYLPKCGGGCPKDGTGTKKAGNEDHCEIAGDVEKALFFDIRRRCEARL